MLSMEKERDLAVDEEERIEADTDKRSVGVGGGEERRLQLNSEEDGECRGGVEVVDLVSTSESEEKRISS